MFRKVSKIGPSTLMISLPSKWVKKFGIKKGHELDVIEEGNVLKIRNAARRSDGAISVHVASETMLKRALISAYIAGYDELSLSVESHITNDVINDVLETLLGYEIVEHSANSYLIRDVARAMNTEFDAILRRLFSMSLSMSEEVLAACKEGDVAKMERIAAVERTTNKFANFCLRVLNKAGHPQHQKLQTLVTLVNELEKIADSYRDICRQGRTKSPASKTIQALVEANAVLKDLHKMFYGFEPDKAESITQKRQAVQHELMEMIRKHHTDHALLAHMLYLVTILAHMEYVIFYR